MLTTEKTEETKVGADTEYLVDSYEYIERRVGKNNALPLLQILYAYKSAREQR